MPIKHRGSLRAHADAIDEARSRHLDRGRIRIGTNFGTFSLEPMDDVLDFDLDGLPNLLTRIEITEGQLFCNGPIDDRMLLIAADAIYRYLDRPPPAVRVDFQAIAGEVKKRRKATK